MTPAPPPPPHVSELPYGTQLIAGLGVSAVIADMDFETYSEAGYLWCVEERKWHCLPGAAQGKKGLPVVGMAAYAMHPTTEVLTFSYDLKDGRGTRRWRPGMPLPTDLFAHLAAGKLIGAWNAGFERWIWERVCVPKYGWPPLPIKQLRCDMAKARAFALPGALAKAGEVLKLAEVKNADGTRLLKKFSMPRNPTKTHDATRIRPEDDSEDAERLYEYCDQDVHTEAEAASRCPDLAGEELEYWQADQEINHRGVCIDLPNVENGIAIIEQATRRACIEMVTLTGGAVSGPTKVTDLLAWIKSRDVIGVTTADEDAIAAALDKDLLPPDVRRVLEIRRDTASAAVKKLYAMRVRTAPDGRARDLFNYHAAHTGRCTMADIQPGNLPNSGVEVRSCACGHTYGVSLPACPYCGTAADPARIEEWGPAAMEDAVRAIGTRSLPYVESLYGAGASVAVVKSTIRGMFCAAPGNDLIVGDYSAIEAVGLAELAGEQWRREVFNSHGKIYEMSAAKAFGVPFEEMMQYRADTGNHHPLRKKGKTLELALGYGGWVSALVKCGADKFMTEDEMKSAIVAWRGASPAIVEFWGGQFRGKPWADDKTPELFGVEGAMIKAIQIPGQWFDVRHGIAFKRIGNDVFCRLPSGRYLTYHNPQLTDGRWPGTVGISFEGWNTNRKQGPLGWIVKNTHGGKLTENITQAACRDILRYATLNLERNGYPVVMHVYDEIISEIPEGYGSVEEFSEIMAERPEWARDWPIRVGKDAFREKRYRK